MPCPFYSTSSSIETTHSSFPQYSNPFSEEYPTLYWPFARETAYIKVCPLQLQYPLLKKNNPWHAPFSYTIPFSRRMIHDMPLPATVPPSPKKALTLCPISSIDDFSLYKFPLHMHINFADYDIGYEIESMFQISSSDRPFGASNIHSTMLLLILLAVSRCKVCYIGG